MSVYNVGKMLPLMAQKFLSGLISIYLHYCSYSVLERV